MGGNLQILPKSHGGGILGVVVLGVWQMSQHLGVMYRVLLSTVPSKVQRQKSQQIASSGHSILIKIIIAVLQLLRYLSVAYCYCFILYLS